jgi:hypothetical protein
VVKRIFFLLLWWMLFSISTLGVSAQSSSTALLFQTKEPLHIRANTKIKYIKKNLNDSTYSAREIYYEKSTGLWDSVEVGVQLHGHFRLENCHFPPTKLKLKKSNTEHTIFEGTKKLKLVVPCQKSSDKDALIVKEYLCYQFYEQISNFHFNTRLLTIDITDYSKKKPEKMTNLGFFIEDTGPVAKRTNTTEIKDMTLIPSRFDAKEAVRNDFFQYMISNVDWSAVFLHNIKVVLTDKNAYIPIPYDFDMSGFVNAFYAHGPTNAGTSSVRERLYRGFCKNETVMQEVRAEFLKLEPAFNSTIDRHAVYFKSAEVKDLKDYLEGFFAILKDDAHFKESILEGCRTK